MQCGVSHVVQTDPPLPRIFSRVIYDDDDLRAHRNERALPWSQSPFVHTFRSSAQSSLIDGTAFHISNLFWWRRRAGGGKGRPGQLKDDDRLSSGPLALQEDEGDAGEGSHTTVSFSELFYDLFFVANLTVFASHADIVSAAEMARFVGMSQSRKMKMSLTIRLSLLRNPLDSILSSNNVRCSIRNQGHPQYCLSSRPARCAGSICSIFEQLSRQLDSTFCRSLCHLQSFSITTISGCRFLV